MDAGQALIIDSSLETETREFASRMSGAQPSDSDWDIFFMRGGGSVDGFIYAKMVLAHEAAKLIKEKTAPTP